MDDRPRKELAIPVSLEFWGMLQISYPMTQAEWDQMLRILEAFRPGIVEPPHDAEEGEG